MNEIPNVIIQRYAEKKGLTILESEKKFKKLQFFLDNAAKSKQTPTLEIDEMWHEFILDTKHYFDFCSSRYKKFIHHIPTSIAKCDSDDEGDGDCSSGISVKINSKSKIADCDSCSSDCSSFM
jgi:hypothetical protein